ncbi:hypothetical protein [uncultured Caulobacter sp.]|jgi:uncharacterized membrane protein YozB (DUF420 family)|uniref:hypothetical protein n=1 Tax=uncultured Caulobacter sp. TaxID=158749 RepID=UPI002619F087|nr:hypothetical protein [uncultured Caulobacter sp.]
MTAIEAGQRPTTQVGRPFYLIMSLLMAAVFIGGFSQTVPDDFRPPGLPLLFHIHGAVFTCWVLVFVAQPAFVARGALKLHRQVGMAGAGLASLMVVMGLAATISAFPAHRVPPFFPPTIFLVMNGVGILVFGGLVTAGIALRRKPEWHKRLMLCATVSILGPGLGRLLPMGSFGAAAPAVMFAVILAFALAGPVADLIVRKRVHPAYAWGVGAIVFSTVLIPPLAFTPQASALVSQLRAL